MRLTVLGSGTPSPSPHRASAGYLLDVPGRTIVLDLGGGAFQRLVEAGRRPEEVTDLFVSHLHSDHVLDIPRLVLSRWDQSAGDLLPLRVFGPAPLARSFDLLFGADGVYAPDIRARRDHPASLAIFAARGGAPPRPPLSFDLRELAAGEAWTRDGLEVRVGRAQHFEPLLDCLCYRIRTEGADLVYAADTGFSSAVAEFACGCDLLVAMCQYLDATSLPDAARRTAASHLEVARMAAMAGAGTLLLSHLSQQFDEPLVRARAHREMAEIYSGPIIWAEDGLSLTVAAAPPAGRFD